MAEALVRNTEAESLKHSGIHSFLKPPCNYLFLLTLRIICNNSNEDIKYVKKT